MASQTYETHRHTPILAGIAFFFILLAVVAFGLRWFEVGGRLMFAVGLLGVIAADVVLIQISRTYTTRLQDRIIKLEMKVRGATLLTPAQQATLAKLEKSQVVALRFAPDEELAGLVERADRERLPAKEIKRAIKNWLPDWDRT